MPKGVDWPVCAKGSLAFLAQFNLADLADTQTGRRLPPEGMLHFFIFNDEETGCAGPGLEVPLVTKTDTIRVIHTTDLTKLRRLSPPDDLGEYNQVAPTRKVEFIEAPASGPGWPAKGAASAASAVGQVTNIVA